MGRILNIKDVTKHPGCVSCHSVPFDKDKFDRDESFHEEEGVSCVACHGADVGWLDMHGSATALKRKRWRDLARGEKERKYGMTDLWDPVKWARLCASCHVGNAEENKVVTHEMYAAGHPPLPGIEIASFSDYMPRHWQYLREKDKKIQDLLKINKAEAELERTNLVAVGTLVTLEESMKLLAAQAKDAKSWPEFAQFDCYACHHDLKTKSWRVERGYSGTPGRPPLRPWPTALAELGIYQSARGDKAKIDGYSRDFKWKLQALQEALEVRPFGKAEAVARQAQELSDWAKRHAESIGAQAAKYDPTTPRRLLAELLRVEKHTTPDYDSARQIAWAFRVLQQEVGPKAKGSLEASPQWKALDKEMNLALPRGREFKILNTLPYSLDRISNYDPVMFRNNLEAVANKFRNFGD
jgi:hypothetical protein